MTQPRSSTVAVRSPTQSSLGRLWYALWRSLGYLLASLMVSVLIEWLGMTLVWSEQGASRSARVLAIEQQRFERQLAVYWLSVDVSTTRRRLSGALAALGQCDRPRRTVEALLALTPMGVRRVAAPYFQAMLTTTHTVLIRCASLILFVPTGLLICAVGLADGLVLRDLRCWGGGRESSFVYHYARRAGALTLIAPLVAYLAWPIVVEPAYVLLPAAFASAAVLRVAASRFKKYL